MPGPTRPQLESPDSYLAAVRDPGNNLRDQYRDDPIALATRLGLMAPRKPLQVMRELGLYNPHDPEDVEKFGPLEPGLRELIEDVCLLAVRSALVIGPRGGGKSQGVSFIEFFLVFIRLFDALNLGGSEQQADQVYRYLLSYIESDEFFQKLVKGDPQISRTDTVDDAWIRVLTASSKSVRSPHAGGRKKHGRMAGGILVIDEEAEAAPEIVSAALPTINTARPSVNVRSSTFHNNEGSFAELVDSHEEMGYKKYIWNIFDVSERCTDLCESCESCFAKDHIDKVINPDTGAEEEKLIHRAYCGGRAHYSEGWVPIEEIKTLWRRGKRNHAVFEVEQMGSRPGTHGHVIKDLTAFASCHTTATAESLYIPHCSVSIAVDWGSSNAAVEVWQEQPGDKHVPLHAELLQQFGESQILGVILGYATKYRAELQEISADIGGGGSYLNPKLREEYGMPVNDVNFAELKETAAAALNVYIESHKIIVPAEHEDFIRQMKAWKRKNGRIAKGDDHLCDAALCYFAKFVDRLGIRRVALPPRTFTPGVSSSPGFTSGGRGSAGAQPVRIPGGIRVIGR